MRTLQKKMQQLENDLDTAQESLMAANSKLEEKEKALLNVSVSSARISLIRPIHRHNGETQKRASESGKSEALGGWRSLALVGCNDSPHLGLYSPLLVFRVAHRVNHIIFLLDGVAEMQKV